MSDKGYPRIISDLHFGHKSMAIHRGFKDEYEHDEFLIEQWNKVIRSPKQLVYILGDITMEKSFYYYQLDRLNGRKIVVLGNHDRHQDVKEMLKYVENVAGMIEYKGFILTHCPIHESELLDKYRGNIHGHNHDSPLNNSRYFNVACEQIGYQPKTIEELLKIQKLKFNL